MHMSLNIKLLTFNMQPNLVYSRINILGKVKEEMTIFL